MIKKLIALLFLANIAYASSSNVVDYARGIYFNDSTYKETLRKGYIKFHDLAVKLNDQPKVEFYSRKISSLMEFESPEITDVTLRKIPLKRVNALLGSMYFLDSAFINDIHQSAPKTSAYAQLMFNCWVDQEEDMALNKPNHSSQLNCQREYLSLENGIKRELKKKKQQRSSNRSW